DRSCRPCRAGIREYRRRGVGRYQASYGQLSGVSFAVLGASFPPSPGPFPLCGEGEQIGGGSLFFLPSSWGKERRPKVGRMGALRSKERAEQAPPLQVCVFLRACCSG